MALKHPHLHSPTQTNTGLVATLVHTTLSMASLRRLWAKTKKALTAASLRADALKQCLDHERRG